MSKYKGDLEEKFTNRWPEFFRDVECGFYLPERWESLVWKMCEMLEHHILRANYTMDVLKVAQVKSKFDGLRFYYDLELEGLDLTHDAVLKAKISATINFAESLSHGIK